MSAQPSPADLYTTVIRADVRRLKIFVRENKDFQSEDIKDTLDERAETKFGSLPLFLCCTFVPFSHLLSCVAPPPPLSASCTLLVLRCTPSLLFFARVGCTPISCQLHAISLYAAPPV